ncbi:malonic semialdehyde reductase [Roseomonas sp. HF4]|uniref:malonic semialdehyde reductase n=1 Tax=Roseomonas sp. HF4 TaxID=2562313 RepID=UPI0010BF9703|nr:malonic semialdehyde reductase [Roseomonas sp. HF4]
MPHETIDDAALDQLFREARTANAWTDRPVPDDKLREMYDLLKMAPTSANASPARFIFVRTPEGKAKLKPALSAGNLEKTMKAPVTVIVAHDLHFYDKLSVLFPHAPDAKNWFTGSSYFAEQTAFRNGSLQGAYLILAARAVGLDAGPMSGFDAAKVDDAFLQGTNWKTNFLVNLGYGDPAGLFPRSPRLDIDEAARFE